MKRVSLFTTTLLTLVAFTGLSATAFASPDPDCNQYNNNFGIYEQSFESTNPWSHEIAGSTGQTLVCGSDGGDTSSFVDHVDIDYPPGVSVNTAPSAAIPGGSGTTGSWVGTTTIDVLLCLSVWGTCNIWSSSIDDLEASITVAPSRSDGDCPDNPLPVACYYAFTSMSIVGYNVNGWAWTWTTGSQQAGYTMTIGPMHNDVGAAELALTQLKPFVLCEYAGPTGTGTRNCGSSSTPNKWLNKNGDPSAEVGCVNNNGANGWYDIFVTQRGGNWTQGNTCIEWGDTRITEGAWNPNTDSDATFEFDATGLTSATYQCKLQGPDQAHNWQTCTSSRTYTDLGNGTYNFSVRATVDGSTDPTPATWDWVQNSDVDPPNTDLIPPLPEDPTNDNNARFMFESNEANSTFECNLDYGGWSDCVGPKNYSDLNDGRHLFLVRATDEAGNTDPTPARHDWNIDTVAPNVDITSGPDNQTSDTNATFEFEVNDSAPSSGIDSIECMLDNGGWSDDGWSDCSSPKTYTGLDEGKHRFFVRATDEAGNTDQTPAARTWMIVPSISSCPPWYISKDCAKKTEGKPRTGNTPSRKK